MDCTNYLNSARQQFLYYKSLAEKSINQLTSRQLFISAGEDSNTIAIIIQHMAGNMLSRWTEFLTTDGEKDWRNRDQEFEPGIDNKDELMRQWDEGWHCLLNTLDSLKPEQLSQTVLIRTEPHTVVEAVNRQLAHYAYHVGQIVFYAKQLKGTDFVSLSIPKNKSQQFNEQEFSRK